MINMAPEQHRRETLALGGRMKPANKKEDVTLHLVACMSGGHSFSQWSQPLTRYAEPPAEKLVWREGGGGRPSPVQSGPDQRPVILLIFVVFSDENYGLGHAKIKRPLENAHCRR